MDGELVEGKADAMHPEGQSSDGSYSYMVETAVARSGLHGFTVRVRPSHPDMSASFIPGLICWADHARMEATAPIHA